MRPRDGSGPAATAGPSTESITATLTKEYEIKGQNTGRIAVLAAGWPTETRGVGDRPDDIEGVSTSEQFEAFHRRNPHFYAALADLARQYKAVTGRTCGVQRLIEVVRYDIEMTADFDGDFKLNNSFAPYFSRLIMAREPDLTGFFRTRKAPEADEWISAVTSTWAA